MWEKVMKGDFDSHEGQTWDFLVQKTVWEVAMAILAASSNTAQWLNVKVLEVIFVMISGWRSESGLTNEVLWSLHSLYLYQT